MPEVIEPREPKYAKLKWLHMLLDLNPHHEDYHDETTWGQPKWRQDVWGFLCKENSKASEILVREYGYRLSNDEMCLYTPDGEDADHVFGNCNGGPHPFERLAELRKKGR